MFCPVFIYNATKIPSQRVKKWSGRNASTNWVRRQGVNTAFWNIFNIKSSKMAFLKFFQALTLFAEKQGSMIFFFLNSECYIKQTERIKCNPEPCFSPSILWNIFLFDKILHDAFYYDFKVKLLFLITVSGNYACDITYTFPSFLGKMSP